MIKKRYETEDKKMNENSPIKDAKSLGIPKMLLLGLQHMFAMFGATILVILTVRDCQYR